MYTIDEKDKVIEMKDVPQSSGGAPCPIVLADEFHIFLLYYAEKHDPDWDGSSVKAVGPSTTDEPVLLVSFANPLSHMFGPPNDEAFSGHPLAERGLKPYGVFEVLQSSWLRTLVRMDSVHPCHRDESFEKYRHFIFSFHDSVFECIAENYQWSWEQGALLDVIPKIAKTMED